MNLIDALTEYAIVNGHSDELFYMLQDYELDNRINRDTLNRIIIKDLGTMRPITTYTNVYKILVDTFFDKYKDNIKRLLDTLDIEYNPLQNKDITETEELGEVIGEEEKRESTGNIDNTDEYKTSTGIIQNDNTTNENQISAFDSATYQNKDKQMGSLTSVTDNEVNHEGETKSKILSDVDTNKDTNRELERTKHITGKDGNDSMQDLIREERKIAEFNIYNWIIEQMRKELFLLVY